MTLTNRIQDDTSSKPDSGQHRLRLVQPGERAPTVPRDPWEIWQTPVYALAGLGGFLAALDPTHRGAYLAEIWTVLLLGIVLTESWRNMIDFRSRAALAGLVLLHAVALWWGYPWLAQGRYLPAAGLIVVEFGLMTWVQTWMMLRLRRS